MSEAQPVAPEVDFLEDAPAAPAAPSPDDQESALTPPEGQQEAAAAAEKELTLQEAAIAARDRAVEIREQLVQVRRIQDALNEELKELDKLCLKAEAPPSLHEQNQYAQQLDQPEFLARSEQAALLAQLAQRLQKKPHPPVFSVKLAQ
jgi:hypothetical protein